MLRIGCVTNRNRLCSVSKCRRVRSSGGSFAVCVLCQRILEKLKSPAMMTLLKRQANFSMKSHILFYRKTWCIVDC